MKIQKILLTTALLLLVALQGRAYSFDFSYSYKNPYHAASQTYIDSVVNAVLYSEGPVRLWKPNIGASVDGINPGIITYHFNFTDPIQDGSLFMNMPTFHWSYSRGHNYLYGSSDGSTWNQMLNVTPPVFGSANGGVFSGALPSYFIGETDIWLKAELYSFGQNATFGGVNTNTAQLSRHDVNVNNTSFALNVNFEKDQGGNPNGNPVPEPATMFLFGTGALSAFIKRRQKA